MRKFCISLLALGLVSGSTIAPAAGASQSKDATAPSYDMKAQSLQDLHDQFVRRAEAIPADKFT